MTNIRTKNTSLRFMILFSMFFIPDISGAESVGNSLVSAKRHQKICLENISDESKIAQFEFSKKYPKKSSRYCVTGVSTSSQQIVVTFSIATNNIDRGPFFGVWIDRTSKKVTKSNFLRWLK
jgi:hypothetical protein